MGPFISPCFCFSLSRLLFWFFSVRFVFARNLGGGEIFIFRKLTRSFLCDGGDLLRRPWFCHAKIHYLQLIPDFFLSLFFNFGIFFQDRCAIRRSRGTRVVCMAQLGRGDLNEWISLAGVHTHSSQMSKMHLPFFFFFSFFFLKTFSNPLFYPLFLTING